MRPAVLASPHQIQFPLAQADDVDAPSEDEDYTESDDEGMKDYRVGGYHPVKIGEIYQRRYRIEAKLGWGHFSTVWLATDWHHDPPKYVAIKFQKSAAHYYEAAHDEIDLLQATSAPRFSATQPPLDVGGELQGLLKSRLPKGNGVVELHDFFTHTGPHGVHVCMVFEVMGPNLLTLIKHYNFQGVPLDLARQIAVHVLVGLDHLHRRCGIIHTDLKPENVLVSRPALPLPRSATEYLARMQAPVPEEEDSNATPLISPSKPAPNQTGSNYKKNRNKKQRRKNKKKKKSKKAANPPNDQTKRLDGLSQNAGSEEAESDSPLDSPRLPGTDPASASTAVAGGTEPSDMRKRANLFSICSELPNSVRLAPTGSEPALHRIRYPCENDPNEKACIEGVLMRPPHNHALYKATHPHMYRVEGQEGPRDLMWLPKNTYDKGSRNEAPLSAAAATPVASDAHKPFGTPAPPDPADIPTDPKLFSTLRTATGDIDLKPSDASLFEAPTAEYKIVDLGNGCWTHRHFSCDIQTRQYRSPEVLMAAGYDTSADIWSFACLMFELVTGDYLFEPKGSEEYTRDEDHLALIIELLGPVPKSLLERARDKEVYFNSDSCLRNIRDLKYWGIEDVLIHRYHFKPAEASYVSDFLLPMLEIEPNKRATAQDMLKHPWLQLVGKASSPILPEQCRASNQQREFAKRQHPDIVGGHNALPEQVASSSPDSRTPRLDSHTPRHSSPSPSSESVSSQSWNTQVEDFLASSSPKLLQMEDE
eukprot:Gregarina_sp_Poly_1__7105@NODE_388_length_8987_cov_115_762892_g317_i0_p1_GENE_NODE_388_length_8987_cov_115_762892_g317_i0NODE_388_length_8987_cov_115_762892_g317_i0_p1_ORF_typecomplete_len762_score126_13Pkinase/PF00069_25/5_7e20Pkinase/PF00069_25/1_1e19Pkinase_Tyr/PF07714_17/3_9e09Pkinase_Tyr/PF07714_17/1_9e06Kinaselike/PF14531_6/0_13Kinaselike/PF14531_6/0_067Pkinase_fungal/PF17667_1/0_0023Kdo/PF06293_14/0_045RIO1/PF01163_22/0_03RIO1/PF01163_22/6_9e03APH/PF01636_23/0_11APH/PF01636_23/1_8e03DUF11